MNEIITEKAINYTIEGLILRKSTYINYLGDTIIQKFKKYEEYGQNKEIMQKLEKDSLQNLSQSKQRMAQQLKIINKDFEEQYQVNQSKRKKVLGFLCLGYMNVFFLISFIICWVYSKEYPNEDLYNQFIDNQNKGVIEDIIVQHNNSECLQGYEYLFEYNWPGTVQSCICNNNQQIKNNQSIFNLYVGVQCTLAQQNEGCQNVSEIANKTLSYLNDNNFSKSFVLCAKRRYGVSLRYNYSYCQEKEKNICGQGSFYYCLPKDVLCPISQIGFTQQFDYKDLYKLNSSEYGKIMNISKEHYFYYIRNQTIMPISQIKMTETAEVCKLNSQNNISPKREDYKSMKIRRIQCQEIDTQFKVVYSINEEQFYLSNNLYALNRSLPYFEIDQKFIWTLQTKPYIQIMDNCQLGQDYQNFLEKEDIKSIKNLSLSIYLLFIFIGLLLIKLFFNHLTKMKQKQNKDVFCFGQIHIYQHFIIFFQVIKLLAHLGCIILLAQYKLSLIRYQKNLNNFLIYQQQCIVTELASNLYDADQLSDPYFIFIMEITIFIQQSIQFLKSLWKIKKICLKKKKVKREQNLQNSQGNFNDSEQQAMGEDN